MYYVFVMVFMNLMLVLINMILGLLVEYLGFLMFFIVVMFVLVLLVWVVFKVLFFLKVDEEKVLVGVFGNGYEVIMVDDLIWFSVGEFVV